MHLRKKLQMHLIHQHILVLMDLQIHLMNQKNYLHHRLQMHLMNQHWLRKLSIYLLHHRLMKLLLKKLN